MERTFVMVKPDGVLRGLCGEVIGRLERKGLKMVAARLTFLSEERVLDQYREHVQKPFFPSLKSHIMSGPCLLMVWEGHNAVSVVRRLVGATNPSEAVPGTIRGDLALDTGRNVIHASDSPESAAREIALHFARTDLVDYTRIDEPVLYEWTE
ncbi:MAG: nucleoside-diphosphate kinase [Methanomicrobiales archaeon]|nr:nucleoside-diphosphate kinase [Methanomicrobiales archaeon]